jgi:hypothetical protein
MRKWYCAQTEPNKEHKARKYLEMSGIPVFLPTYLTKDKSRHLKVNLLIKGYVFFSLDDPALWPRLRTITGILKVITTQSDQLWYAMPSEAASKEIEHLRGLCLSYDEYKRDGGGMQRRTETYITAGCHVRMSEGSANPFAEWVNIQQPIVEWTDEARACLPIMMFGRENKIEFYLKDLERC